MLQAVYFAHGDILVRIYGPDVDFVCVVDNAVKDGVSDGIVAAAELFVPLAFVILRAEDGRGVFPAFVDEFRNVLALFFLRREQQPFVKDE